MTLQEKRIEEILDQAIKFEDELRSYGIIKDLGGMTMSHRFKRIEEAALKEETA